MKRPKLKKYFSQIGTRLSVFGTTKIINGFSNLAKYAFFVVIVAAISIASTLIAPQLHENYLRSSVGSVVIKIVRDSTMRSGGTGFVVKAPSGKDYVLTNFHVCSMNKQKVGDLVLVSTPDGSRQMLRRILDISDKADLCLIESIPGMGGVTLANNYNIGQQVAIVGHPKLNPLTISRGQIISRKTIEVLFELNIPKDKCLEMGSRFRYLDLAGNFFALMQGVFSLCYTEDTVLETNALTYPGNSGSPIVDFFGNLVGVIFAGNNDTNWGYVVPLDYVSEFLSVW